MALLALGIERIILRPLVARPPLSLFMATIGLGFFLEGSLPRRCGERSRKGSTSAPDTPFEVAGFLLAA
jgi:branched-chain amino acid transport system permease protein